MSGAAIGGYEADKSEPALSVIEALAEFYGVRKPWLAFNEGAMLEGDTGVVRDKPIPSRDNLAGTSVPTAKRRKA